MRTIAISLLLAFPVGCAQGNVNENDREAFSTLNGENGQSYPYIEYREVGNEARPNIVGYFLNPIFPGKKDILQLKYYEEDRKSLRYIFEEDLVGISGSIYSEGNLFRSSFFYMADPYDESEESWTMSLGKDMRQCKMVDRKEFKKKTLRKYVCKYLGRYFSYDLDSDRGIIRYQDFCENRVCNYILIGRNGLYSREFYSALSIEK